MEPQFVPYTQSSPKYEKALSCTGGAIEARGITVRFALRHQRLARPTPSGEAYSSELGHVMSSLGVRTHVRVTYTVILLATRILRPTVPDPNRAIQTTPHGGDYQGC